MRQFMTIVENASLYFVQPDGSWKKGGDARSEGKTREEVEAEGLPITEGVREGTVYHWTTAASLMRILADDMISVGSSTHNIDGKTLSGVSVTRDAFLDLSQTYAVSGRKVWRIGLSLDRLRHNLRVMPVRDEYLRNKPRGATIKQRAGMSDFYQSSSSDEREEFVIGNIGPLSRYITSVAVLEDSVDPTVTPWEFDKDPDYYESEYDMDRDDQIALFAIMAQANPAMYTKVAKREPLSQRFDWPEVPLEIIRGHSSGPIERVWSGYLSESEISTPEQIVAQAIEHVMSENPGKTPEQINRGQCDELADTLERTDSNRFQSIELGNLFQYDDGEPTGFDTRLLKKHWPHVKPFPGLTWADMYEKADLNWTGIHIWAYCHENQLHYDIETPEGVRNPFNLRFFASWHQKFGRAPD